MRVSRGDVVNLQPYELFFVIQEVEKVNEFVEQKLHLALLGQEMEHVPQPQRQPLHRVGKERGLLVSRPHLAHHLALAQ